jgi:hypothetical protein
MARAVEKTMQELGDEFLMVAGSCISQWAGADEVLFLLCHRILRTTVEHSAIVYYRTPTLDARMSLASDLVGSVIPRPKRKGEHVHPDQKTWSKIERDFRDLLLIRNRIAHEHVWPTFRVAYDDELKGHRPFVSGFELFASQHERARGRAERPALRIDDLRAHLFATSEITGRIHQFRYGPLPKHIQAFVSQFPVPIPP